MYTHIYTQQQQQQQQGNADKPASAATTARFLKPSLSHDLHSSLASPAPPVHGTWAATAATAKGGAAKGAGGAGRGGALWANPRDSLRNIHTGGPVAGQSLDNSSKHVRPGAYVSAAHRDADVEYSAGVDEDTTDSEDEHEYGGGQNARRSSEGGGVYVKANAGTNSNGTKQWVDNTVAKEVRGESDADGRRDVADSEDRRDGGRRDRREGDDKKDGVGSGGGNHEGMHGSQQQAASALALAAQVCVCVCVYVCVCVCVCNLEGTHNHA
jgi:hypothetical protein